MYQQFNNPQFDQNQGFYALIVINNMLKNQELYDVIVIGLGCVGLSTCHHLASKGLKVIGIEQFPNSGHYGSSSFGQARIWRHL